MRASALVMLEAGKEKAALWAAELKMQKIDY